MPSIITRYLIRELTSIFLIAFVGLMVVLITIGLIQQALDRGLSPEIILKLIPYAVPKAMMFGLPAATLLAVCVVPGRMAHNNEIAALFSLGVRPTQVYGPLIGFGLVASLLAVWANDIGFAWSYWGVERTVVASARELTLHLLRTEGRFENSNLQIEVNGIEGDILIEPIIHIGGSRPLNITAVKGRLSGVRGGAGLRVELNNGLIEQGGSRIRFPDEFVYELSVQNPIDLDQKYRTPSHLYLSEIPAARQALQSELESLEQDQMRQAAVQMISGDWLGLTDDDWQQREMEHRQAEFRLRRLEIVPHRRWANGFSCLAFALLGIPVSIRLRTPDFWTAFGACFFPILIAYYPIFMFGLNAAKQGTLPPTALWISNLVFFVIGGWWIYRQGWR